MESDTATTYVSYTEAQFKELLDSELGKYKNPVAAYLGTYETMGLFQRHLFLLFDSPKPLRDEMDISKIFHEGKFYEFSNGDKGFGIMVDTLLKTHGISVYGKTFQHNEMKPDDINLLMKEIISDAILEESKKIIKNTAEMMLHSA
ncbi:MAG TPA: hypothetical protein VI894_00950 [Candidatus Nanoarchaeia archaeon]|nr:hypothetical protein [Candidatus Nanoarchaeia archaeon]